MKNRIAPFLIIILLLFFNSIDTTAQSKKARAKEYATQAIKMMDNGDSDGAIKLLKKAKKLDGKKLVYDYEIAYAHCLKKEYAAAIKVLEPKLSHKEVTHQHYQLIGNSYDYLGKPEKAMEIYKKGLEKFPDAGELYLEQGVLEYGRDNYDEAVNYWEKGALVKPEYSSNYYWLAIIYSFSEERIWSVIYGEIFMNLEPNTKRTELVSKLLYDMYDKSVDIESDTAGGVSFYKQITITPSDLEGEFKMPLQMDYGMTMTLGLTPIMLESNGDTTISIKRIYQLRKAFVELWFENEKDKAHPNCLFTFQKKIKEAGHLEAYTYWMLMKGNQEEFDQWIEDNEPDFEAFVQWYNQNNIDVTDGKNFSRLKIN